jgi:hypothetical protein
MIPPHSGTTFTTNQGYVYGYYKDWLHVLGTVYSKVCFNFSLKLQKLEILLLTLEEETSKDVLPM